MNNDQTFLGFVTRCRQMVESYQQWGVLEPGEVSIVHYGQIHWPSRGWMIIYDVEEI
jgi:hypothetical protein